ncbi:endonuclease NucS [Thermococcus sp. 2319x1]|uniref:endonuclease NucS n=1 Tax=Thermococcus sp. 2319x1 TaxID=1674923 RepID=UPI0015838321|nr:endonuclease NucS [Thermococcus sp. 2319x1]
MKVEAKLNPTYEEMVDIFNRALSKEAIINIFAHCRVFYDGRAKSELGPGDRVILIKPDGSFLIHQKEKREPVNWQPPGSSVGLEVKEGRIFLRSIRRKPREILEVELLHVYLISYFQAEDYEELALTGSEAEMADLIFENPSVIEDGFKPLFKEKPIKHGIVDVLGVDKEGNIVVLELKRRRADLHAVSQLKRYVEAMKEEHEKVRGILVAPSLTSGAKKLLEKEGLEFRRLTPPKRGKSKGGRQKTLFD